MKRISIWVLVLLTISLTTGCGGRSTPVDDGIPGSRQPDVVDATEGDSNSQQLFEAEAEPTSTADEQKRLKPVDGKSATDPDELHQTAQLADTTEPQEQPLLHDTEAEKPQPTAAADEQQPELQLRSEQQSDQDGIGEEAVSSQQPSQPEVASAGGGGDEQGEGATSDGVASMFATQSSLWEIGPAPSDIETDRRSYLIAGVGLHEGTQFSNANNVSNSFRMYAGANVSGTLKLVREAGRFRTALDYKGGTNFHRATGSAFGGHTIQQMSASETISWEKMSVALQDSLSDSPGASFGSGAFGGASSYTLGYGGDGSGTSNFLGSNDFGGFGRRQHITNVAVAQGTRELSQRSNLTFGGAYALTHYFDRSSIDSQQYSTFAAYSYQLSGRSQISGSYGYQHWKYRGISRNANVLQVNFSRQMSQRMSLSLGAGPQLLTSRTPTIFMLVGTPIPIVLTSRQTGLSAEAVLTYTLGRQNFGFVYEHMATSGSGFFPGAKSDIFTMSAQRPLFRNWATSFGAGYVRLSSLGGRSSGILGNAYQYGYVSVGAQRAVGRHSSISASYQFNDQTHVSACETPSGCGRILHSAIISFNFNLHTLPMRLGREGPRDTAPGTDVVSGTNDNPPVDPESPR